MAFKPSATLDLEANAALDFGPLVEIGVSMTVGVFKIALPSSLTFWSSQITLNSYLRVDVLKGSVGLYLNFLPGTPLEHKITFVQLSFPGGKKANGERKWICVSSDLNGSQCPDEYFITLGDDEKPADAPQILCLGGTSNSQRGKCQGKTGVQMDFDKAKKFAAGRCEKGIHCLRPLWKYKKDAAAKRAALAEISKEGGSRKKDLERMIEEQDAYCWKGLCQPKTVSSGPEAGLHQPDYKECHPNENDHCQSGVCRTVVGGSSGKCVDGYPDSGMGVSAHCHNRICDSDTCDDGTTVTNLVQEFSAPAKSRQSRALLGRPKSVPPPPPPPPRAPHPSTVTDPKGDWLPTKYVRPCYISKAECKRQIYLFREKCYWNKRKIASACDHRDQCAPYNGKSHCFYPYGWTTGTCSQCKVHGDCKSNHYCKQSGSTAGSMTSFNANRARNLCVPQLSTGSGCGSNIECKTGKCEGTVLEGTKCSECTGGCLSNSCSTSRGCSSGKTCMGRSHGGRTCQSKLGTGKHCEHPNECSSGFCEGWKCAACKGGCLSNSCSTSRGCPSGKMCMGRSHNGRTCQSKLGTGKHCEHAQECSSGKCSGWNCAAPPPPPPKKLGWTGCYKDEQCANRRRRNRDNCIKEKCVKKGGKYDGSWKDCGGWKFKGHCTKYYRV